MSGFTVRVFAGLADRLGGREVRVDLGEAATGADLVERLAEDHPAAADLLRSSRIAVNREFADPGTPVPPGAEIALIPPVSGG